MPAGRKIRSEGGATPLSPKLQPVVAPRERTMTGTTSLPEFNPTELYFLSTACAAASRAMGSRYGEQET